MMMSGRCLRWRHAQQLVADGEADGMLALWSDSQAALCMTVEAGDDDKAISALLSKPDSSPSRLARDFQLMVQQV